ncbi:hypothetical protein GCM10028832_13420 [Streptomyces sparsus]
MWGTFSASRTHTPAAAPQAYEGPDAHPAAAPGVHSHSSFHSRHIPLLSDRYWVPATSGSLST